ncbi:aldo/keto reductase [Sneathiella glossodoripedis]|uniref:aldo/keto reductase n=1 Tax=Sneathiella glossodoripedis TaxID=418853 RepID=UPI0004729A98|nr:aldo/keto reductase [Sneathiella glossodoripedis]
MRQREIVGNKVSAIGFGCMNLSSGYGPGPDEAYGARVLNEALDAGYSFMDTATVYGLGKNEQLVGKSIGHRRDEFFLASKCGLRGDANGNREINGRPEVILESCDASLKRLGVEQIDLYYLHRMDPNVPIEDTVGAFAQLVDAGKIRYVGLSEISADILRRANAVHPIAAVQNEYSLWTRNPEIALLDTCRELGVTFVAFSPVARQFLTGKLQDVTNFHPQDIRVTMPRFQPEAYSKNLELLEEYANLAQETGCTMAQLAIAWLLERDENIIPIPGTTKLEHMYENAGADGVRISPEVMQCLDKLINQNTVVGGRYDDRAEATVFTENFT